MSIIFSNRVLHGTKEFLPKPVYGFENADHEAYFLAAFPNDCEKSKVKADVVIGADEIEIDPETIHNETRLRVADLIGGSNG